MVSRIVFKYLVRSRIQWLSILMSGVFLTCTYSKFIPEPNSYFPLDTDFYTVYKISETKYPINSQPISKTYYLKQQLSSVADENSDSGTKKFQLQRFKKNSLQAEWQLDSIWIGTISLNNLIISENNQRYIKLVFPFKKNTIWNTNELNTFGKSEIKYSEELSNQTVNGLVFTDCINAVAKADSNLLIKQVFNEIYAPKVGLIIKEQTKLDYCQSTPDCIGKKIINFGYTYKQELIDYKK